MSSDGSAGGAVDDQSMSSRSSSEDSTAAAAEANPDAAHEVDLAGLPAADLVDHLYRNSGREDVFDEAAHVLAGRDRRLAEVEAELRAGHKAADRLLDDIREQEKRSPDVATMTAAWLRDEVRARDHKLAEAEHELRGAHKVMDDLLQEISKERSAAEANQAMVARLRDEIAEARAQIRRAVESEAGLRAELEARDREIAALEAEISDVRRRHDGARRPPRVNSPPPHGQPVPVDGQRDGEALAR